MPSLRSPRDARLVDRIAAGDVDAWATVDSRYRPALRRYVGSLARPGTIDPDDVVQDALMRAFDRLRRGDGPDQLRPWLYRLCRNAAIDAIRARTRHRDDELSGNEAAAAATEPERTVLRRERLRRITADVAALPDRQRVALLARAVDGRPVGEIGAELGISNDAVHMTVQRARESLMRSEHARDADCEQIRVLLHDAHDRRVRPRETARLHLKSCAGCRAYREDLRRVDHQLRALAPPVLPLLAVLAAHAGLTTKGAAVGAGIATAGTVAVAVTGGLILVGGVQRRDAGEPAPFRLSGVRGYVDHRVVQGDPVPGRTSIVTARVRMPASPTSTRGGEFVTLRCPAGMIVGGLQAPINEHSDIRWNPNPPILERPERQARIELWRPRNARRDTTTVGIVCRRPDRNGSILAHPRTARPGERPAHLCLSGSRVRRARAGLPAFNTLYRRPGREQAGYSPMDGTPISVVRTTSNRRWSYVIADSASVRGWIDRRLIC